MDAAETVLIVCCKDVNMAEMSLMCQVEEDEVDLPGLELIEDDDCGCHIQV